MCDLSSNERPVVKLWRSIKGRMSKHYRPGNESYKDCELSESWKDIRNFEQWYDLNYVEGWDIDKDLFGWDTKIYSEETCCFLPPRLNLFMVNLRSIFDGSMKGWYYRERDGVFVATVSDTAKRKIHLGHFQTSEDAKTAYVAGKFKVLDSIIAVYKEALPERVTLGLVSLKHKVLHHYNLTLKDLETVDSLKIKRNRKCIKVGQEELLVTDFARILNMKYRHLYSLIYLKKWPLEKILYKYDKDSYFDISEHVG